MSKPRFDWWSNASNMVRNYPSRKAEYEELHRQIIAAQISGMPHNSNVSRTVEVSALREMPPARQKEYDAVNSAIHITEMYPNGKSRLELIRLMYWNGGKRNIADISPALYISEATGKRWHSDFIRLVGVCFGYEL